MLLYKGFNDVQSVVIEKSAGIMSSLVFRSKDIDG
jgi:hypothetical protein